MNFEHQRIENTTLLATWLRRVDPNVFFFFFLENIANFRKIVPLCRLQSKLPNPTDIPVDPATFTNFDVAISCAKYEIYDSTDDLTHNFFFNLRPAA
jgi:hypothetical protein